MGDSSISKGLAELAANVEATGRVAYETRQRVDEMAGALLDVAKSMKQIAENVANMAVDHSARIARLETDVDLLKSKVNILEHEGRP